MGRNFKVALLIVLALIILLIISLAVAKGSLFSFNTKAPAPEPVATTTEHSGIQVKLFFSDSVETATSGDCTETFLAYRELPFTLTIGDASLKALFAGPNPAERIAGARSYFEPSKDAKEGTKPLRDYYLGLNIADGVAYVNFSPDALQYLNAPACMQAAVKNSIQRTLMQFKTVKEVKYMIDGKPFDA